METVNNKALNTSEKWLLQQFTNLVQDDLQPGDLIISCGTRDVRRWLAAYRYLFILHVTLFDLLR